MLAADVVARAIARRFCCNRPVSSRRDAELERWFGG
jgi:hypothetical protein